MTTVLLRRECPWDMAMIPGEGREFLLLDLLDLGVLAEQLVWSYGCQVRNKPSLFSRIPSGYVKIAIENDHL